jgi:ribonuclease-3
VQAANAQVLESILGHTFRNKELLVRALTHKSLSSEKKIDGTQLSTDNEQLEFLGDAILGFVVSEALVTRFPSYPEGRLSKLKAHLVSAAFLLKVARNLNLGTHLLLSRGEEMSGGRDKRALLANALEAVIAAIYLDAGIAAVRTFIADKLLTLWEEPEPGEKDRITDYKTALQDQTRALRLPLPRYIIANEEGPEHAKSFTIEARVGNFVGRGEGPSKKAAGQAAAKLVLEQLSE